MRHEDFFYRAWAILIVLILTTVILGVSDRVITRETEVGGVVIGKEFHPGFLMPVSTGKTTVLVPIPDRWTLTVARVGGDRVDKVGVTQEAWNNAQDGQRILYLMHQGWLTGKDYGG